jgi:hypothetical protein
MTRAQQVHERVDALVEQGATKAAAYEQTATEFGLKVNSVRGAYYQHSRKANGGSSRSRTRETTTADAVASATAVLEKAMTAIDEEIVIAKERADEARAEYDALKASAAERKQAIKAKIDTLSA